MFEIASYTSAVPFLDMLSAVFVFEYGISNFEGMFDIFSTDFHKFHATDEGPEN